VRIVHIGQFSSRIFREGSVCGNFNALWALARAQAGQGHDVSMIRIGKTVSDADRAVALAHGVNVIGVPCRRWRGLWRDEADALQTALASLAPDIAHLFYVRVPKFFYIARLLRRRGIPYVVSPHGGVKSTEMARKRLRKVLYWHGIEKQVHQGAAGIHFVSEGERADYARTLKVKPRVSAVIPNIVELPPDAPSWSPGMTDVLRLVYLGRYDVWCKGLDLTLAMTRRLRQQGVEAEVHIYGSADGRFAGQMKALRETFSDVPLRDHGYVGGGAKYREMAAYDFYVQYSRSDVFGLSLAEAMGVGVPAIVSERSDLTQDLAPLGAVLSVPMDPSAGATVVAEALSDRARVLEISRRGKEWVRTECGAGVVASRTDAFYEEALRE
jgi:glycosyltransferase involved in cell wall biosynthesis